MVQGRSHSSLGTCLVGTTKLFSAPVTPRKHEPIGVKTAVEAFRAHLTEISDGTTLECCSVACAFVETLTLGVVRHLPDVQVEARVSRHEESCSLNVHFGSLPIIGEIATRSRIPFDVWIASDLRFSMSKTDPVKLHISGLQMIPLADVRKFRELYRESQEESSVYQYWMNSKDEFPLETSKLRRIIQSLHDQTGFRFLPETQQVITIEGFTKDEDGFKLTGFTFRECGKNVAMTLHEEPIGSAEVARERNEWGKKIFSDPINRKMGEKFSASALALGRLKFGHALGLEGANPSLVMKLFSAATWWGAGSAGWHQFDHTWTCTDHKDSFGSIVEEQGRIIWRLDGDVTPGSNRVTRKSSRGGQIREGSAVPPFFVWVLFFIVPLVSFLATYFFS